MVSLKVGDSVRFKEDWAQEISPAEDIVIYSTTELKVIDKDQDLCEVTAPFYKKETGLSIWTRCNKFTKIEK